MSKRRKKQHIRNLENSILYSVETDLYRKTITLVKKGKRICFSFEEIATLLKVISDQIPEVPICKEEKTNV